MVRRGRDVQLTVVPGAGHDVHTDVAEIFDAVVEVFLAP
jgi:hypothetical protein